MPEILRDSDIVTLTSKREGLPRCVMEAMAAGKPVVATDVRGNRDLVDDGHTGFLVRLGDVCGLAAALERLICDRSCAPRWEPPEGRGSGITPWRGFWARCQVFTAAT